MVLEALNALSSGQEEGDESGFVPHDVLKKVIIMKGRQ